MHPEDRYAVMAPPDRRWWITKRASAACKETKWQTYLLYCRFIYRHHMRLIHRRGKHWFTHLRPMGGPEMDWCQWCGERRIRS